MVGEVELLDLEVRGFGGNEGGRGGFLDVGVARGDGDVGEVGELGDEVVGESAELGDGYFIIRCKGYKIII